MSAAASRFLPAAVRAKLIDRPLSERSAVAIHPLSFLGLRLSEAMVLRNAGGRVTDRVIADLSFTTFMAQTMAAGSGIEIAVIHHTQCGTGFLADEAFRSSYAAHSGYPENDLVAEAVTDPFATVQHDTELLLTHPLLPQAVSVSGHVYDLATGEITTVVPARLTGALR